MVVATLALDLVVGTPTNVPLADGRGAVAGRLQRHREADLGDRQSLARVAIAVHAEPLVVTTGQERASRRAADGRRDMCVRADDAIACDGAQVRHRLSGRGKRAFRIAAVARRRVGDAVVHGQVIGKARCLPEALVISEDHDDVRSSVAGV